MFFEFISINNLLEISESFGCIIEDFGFLDSFSDNLIEDDLKSKRNARSIKIVVIIFAYFFDFRIVSFLWLFFTGISIFFVVRHEKRSFKIIIKSLDFKYYIERFIILVLDLIV